jgi:hypothetical protein
MRVFKYFLLFQLALFAHLSFSLEPVRFGPEFTFMPDPNLNIGGLFERMNRHLIEEQPEGAKFHLDHGYKGRSRWTSPNGWWTALYADSGGFEVNVKPMTVDEYKKYAADLQDAIFVSAANIGHFPALWQGGGHINIDVENFRRNPLLFRNFMVDLVNHNELYFGIFNYDLQNAVPPQRTASFDNDFRQSLKQLDAELPNPKSEVDYNKLADKFYLYFFGVGKKAIELIKRAESRIEFRAVRPQASIDVFIRQIELIEARLRYLENFKTPISYEPQAPLEATAYADFARYSPRPPIDPQKALQAFYRYVTESGQLWRNHRDYLWPQWISGGELEKFEMSEWFKSREREGKSDCGRLLI